MKGEIQKSKSNKYRKRKPASEILYHIYIQGQKKRPQGNLHSREREFPAPERLTFYKRPKGGTKQQSLAEAVH